MNITKLTHNYITNVKMQLKPNIFGAKKSYHILNPKR